MIIKNSLISSGIVMNNVKLYQYAHSRLHWDNERDFQVVCLWDNALNNETVLLVPAPWSSPLDTPKAWEENQRMRLAKKINHEWYTVLTMIPPGKPNHFFSWTQSAFSFDHYAHCIESVLYRDVFKKSVTHIVTSSLWQIATVLALKNNMHDTHKQKQQRKIIIGAPIDSLQHVLQTQQKQYWWMTTDLLIQHYATHHWLTLDPSIEHELQDKALLALCITDLVDAWYRHVNIYGNHDDVYYTWNDAIDIMKTYFFKTSDQNDPFHHSFSQQSAEEALTVVTQFLRDDGASTKMITPAQLFIQWFYKKGK